MQTYNKIIIIGYLGRDPQLRHTQAGNAVCDFSVATSEQGKDNSGEKTKVTTWFKVTCWNGLAEVAAKYLVKGRPVYIEGRLQAREWTDRDGLTRTSLEVNADVIQMLDSRDEEHGAQLTVEEDEHTAKATRASSNKPPQTTSTKHGKQPVA